MRKQFSIFLFSLMFFTSVMSIPLNLALEEDLAHPSSSNTVSYKPVPIKKTASDRNGLEPVSDNLLISPSLSSSRSSSRRKSSQSNKGNRRLIDKENDNFIEENFGENEYLVPPPAVGGSHVTPSPPKPRPRGTDENLAAATINARTTLNKGSTNALSPPPASGGGRVGPPPPKPGPRGTDSGLNIPGNHVQRFVDDDDDIEEEFDEGDDLFLAPPSGSGSNNRFRPLPPKPGTKGTKGESHDENNDLPSDGDFVKNKGHNEDRRQHEGK